VPTADVRVAAAEALPFGEDEFDAVLAQLGVGHSGAVYLSLDDRAQQREVRADAHRRLGAPAGAFRLSAKVRNAPTRVAKETSVSVDLP
jgi:hypothetical protein